MIPDVRWLSFSDKVNILSVISTMTTAGLELPSAKLCAQVVADGVGDRLLG